MIARVRVDRPSNVSGMASPLNLVEFPADDPKRALRFWTELLGLDLEPRTVGEGWQTASPGPAIGVHERGRGPGDSFSLPYFEVDDLPAALAQVQALGGSVVHPGEVWSVCRDSEGSPFGLTKRSAP
jgi:predicted enzyme related to lactoylglutathione lyase